MRVSLQVNTRMANSLSIKSSAHITKFLEEYGPRMVPGDKTYGVVSFIGLECEASTALYELKTLGVIAPDVTREEFELRYTHLYDGISLPEQLEQDRDYSAIKLPTTDNHKLRYGGHGAADPANRSRWANLLRDTDWAKLTGASMYDYSVDAVTIKEAREHLAAGTPVYKQGEHHSVLISDLTHTDNPASSTTYSGGVDVTGAQQLSVVTLKKREE